ncbi:hypothetical protein GCM10023214_42020 [Amycolatopsis dongchuanensis]|uniref:Uncharacterized protein n=1 Tax=Amycolatopsis dongchuanensis TaxID=1070866 RepID=A0ABP9QUJ9_9PSEU
MVPPRVPAGAGQEQVVLVPETTWIVAVTPVSPKPAVIVWPTPGVAAGETLVIHCCEAEVAALADPSAANAPPSASSDTAAPAATLLARRRGLERAVIGFLLPERTSPDRPGQERKP